MFLNSGITAAYAGSNSVSKIYLGSNLIWPLSVDYKTKYLTMKFLSSGYICFKKNNSTSPSLTVFYSKNGGEWTSVLSDDATQISVIDGDEIRWKGTNSAYSTGVDDHCSFSGTSTFNLYGNILSLKYGDNFNVQNDTLDSYAFNKLFTTSRVVDAYNVPLEFGTLNERSLRQLFSNCTYIQAGPAMVSANTVNNLGAGAMFYHSSIISGTSIYAGTLNGTQNFAQIYEGCTALTSVPVIYLGNATEACLSQSFYNCKSLKKTPDLLLSALSRQTYYRMFYTCSNLEYIKCLATSGINVNNSTYQWLRSVSATGTFVKKTGVVWPSGVNGIPSGWTVIEED